MTDWLKFIGKLYIERKTRPQTIGLMLALSGANGNVVGSYKKDFADDISVQLIANDDLIKLLHELYVLPQIKTVKESIKKYISTDISEVNLVYYNNKIWWLIEFANQKFTLCHKDGKPATKVDSQVILELLPAVIEYQVNDFIDLDLVLKTNSLIGEIEKWALTIVVQEQKCDFENLYLGITCRLKTESIEKFYINEAIKWNPFMEMNGNYIYLKENINMIEFYRYIFRTKKVTLDLIVSDFYQKHIDKSLLQNIWAIQNGYKVEENQEEDVIKLLKMSPLALNSVLFPNPILQGYEKTKGDMDMCRMHHSYMMNFLTNCFMLDVQNPSLVDIYYNYFNIKVLRINNNISVEFKDGTSLNVDSTKNLAIMKLGGNICGVMLKDNVELLD